jgi:tetratricopeptide (TPR) repeat protein
LELARLRAETTAFDEALVFAAEARQLAAVEDPWRACRAEIEAANVLLYQARHAEAMAAYARLGPICDAAGWRLDSARVRVLQGLTETQQGNLAAAEGYLAEALAIYQAEATGYYTAICQRGLASVYWRIGRHPEAETSIRAALAAFQALGHEVAVGRCYQMLGLIFQTWNRYEEALAAYGQALGRYAAAHLPREQIAMEVNQALIYEERGYYDAALVRYEQALAASRGRRLTMFTASILDSMARLHGRLGRYREAVLLYRRARLHFHRAHSVYDAQIHAAQQAGVLHLLGEEQAAQRLLRQARRYFVVHDHPAPLAFCDLTLGEITAARGRPRRALAHYRAAAEYFTAHGQRADAALARLLMGEAHLAAGELVAAEPELCAAAAYFGPTFPDLAGRAEHALGRAAVGQGRAREAADHWQGAVDYVALARRGILTESHAGSFYESRRRIYEDALDGWLAVSEPGNALAVAEAAKGQVLAALLGQRDVQHAAFGAQTAKVQGLWEQALAVGRELEALRTRWPAAEAGGTRSLLALSDALAAAPKEKELAPSLRSGQVLGLAKGDRLVKLAEEQARLFDRIRRSATSFELLDPARPFAIGQLREVAQRVCGAGWSALAYYLRRDQVTIFWFTAETIASWTRPLSRLALFKLSQAVDSRQDTRELVYADRLRTGPHPDPPGPRLLRDLADLLIPAEVRAGLAPDRRLLIAAHGLLHYLPFHALTLVDGRPLLEHATVSYAPTLRIWETLQERQPRGAAGNQAMVCGIGEFGGRASALAYAEPEARHLAALLGPDTRLVLGKAATYARIRQWSDDDVLAGFAIIHLATHARFDAGRPLQSGILLADGTLTLPDLFRLRLNARLVTLSACQTALSALEPGDELLGLREALLAAGAKSLLVSLWPVDDASTGRLMSGFYERLLSGLAPVEALADAQRALRAAGESPYHWAPFVLVG